MIQEHERIIRWRDCEREDLTPEQRDDLDGAEVARTEANPVETKFTVGSVIRMQDDYTQTGSNDETHVHFGVHAETNAKQNVPPEHRNAGLKRVTIVAGPSADEEHEVIYPTCGICLQVLSELLKSGDNPEMVMAAVHGRVRIALFRDMLPFLFDPDCLKKQK